MQAIQRGIIQRHTHKTSEGEFLYELENLFNFSPKESGLVLESAKHYLIREDILKEGQIEVSVLAVTEKSGKLIEKSEKKRVLLTIESAIEDREIQKEYGRISLRLIRIQRITTEAIEQGGILTQEDIARYLSCTVRTIQRDIRAIKEQGIGVITRGVLHNIGRCQTHKSQIVGLYLDGKTFSDIKLKTHHSSGAIKRYLDSFIKVLMSVHHGIKDKKDISSVTGLSEVLVKQYVELLEQSKKQKYRRQKLSDIIHQWKRAGTRLKKSLILDEFGRKAVHMTGGVI